jgi:hypothetical protein
VVLELILKNMSRESSPITEQKAFTIENIVECLRGNLGIEENFIDSKDEQAAMQQQADAISNLEQGDPAIARILLESAILFAEAALTPRRLEDDFGEGESYTKRRGRETRKARLQKFEESLRALNSLFPKK